MFFRASLFLPSSLLHAGPAPPASPDGPPPLPPLFLSLANVSGDHGKIGTPVPRPRFSFLTGTSLAPCISPSHGLYCARACSSGTRLLSLWACTCVRVHVALKTHRRSGRQHHSGATAGGHRSRSHRGAAGARDFSRRPYLLHPRERHESRGQRDPQICHGEHVQACSRKR
jgi:hypothetical protein